MTSIAKLRWQCRRGMKELDLLMEGYLDHHYATATPAARQAFEALLELPDPTLHGYLLGRETPQDPLLDEVLGMIRDGR